MGTPAPAPVTVEDMKRRVDADRLRDFAAIALADGRPDMAAQLRAIADRLDPRT